MSDFIRDFLPFLGRTNGADDADHVCTKRVDFLRNIAKAALCLAQEQVAGLDIRFDLRLAIQDALQVDHPKRRRRIVAWQLQPPSRADLRLQPKQLKLIELHLADEALTNEKVANTRRRNRSDSGHWER
ncbi:MAG TPA: hypothetical protein VHK01_13555 [Lacipirellulaceae bacterium]|nr:hypothetical protein [Lacipirellulaceae bacterium]